jgi:hypothetical protein
MDDLAVLDFYPNKNIPINQVTLGRVVRDTEWVWNDPPFRKSYRVSSNRYGHVVGFGRSCVKEILIKVLWEDETTTLIHPANIELLE